MYYLIINETPINEECEQKCFKTNTLSLKEPLLKEFILQCCLDFINNSFGGWTSDTDERIDELNLEDKAKWLLGDCLSTGDFGDILTILKVEDGKIVL